MMTESGIVVPWWLLSLMAGVLMTVMVWQRQRLRRGSRKYLAALIASLGHGRDISQRLAADWYLRADTAFDQFHGYLSRLRYRLAVVDYGHLLTTRWRVVEDLCRRSDELVSRIQRELDESQAVAPEEPEWVAAAYAISRLPETGSQPATAKIFEALLSAAQTQHAEAMREFRWEAVMRGRALLASASLWRRLNSQLSAIVAFGRALKRGEEQLARASLHVDQLSQIPRGRRLLKTFINGVMATVALGLGIWFGLFLLDVQQARLAGIGAATGGLSGWAAIWPAFYLTALLLLGAMLVSALRWSDVLPAVAELGLRWRIRLGLVSVLVLLALSVAGMQSMVMDMRVALVAAEGLPFAAWLAGAALYGLPLFVALQLAVLTHWLRASRPLVLLALAWSARSVYWLLAALHSVLLVLRQGIADGGDAPAMAGNTRDSIKLVKGVSGKQ